MGCLLNIMPAQKLKWCKRKEIFLGFLRFREEARRLRDEARVLLRDGKHPTRDKKAEKLRQSVAGENTFEAVARKWLVMKSKQLNAKYAKQTLARMEQHVFPLIGALPIKEITIPDVVRVVEKMGEHGSIVNLCSQRSETWLTTASAQSCARDCSTANR